MQFDLHPYIDVHAHIGVTVSRARPIGQDLARYMARMATSSVHAAILSPTAGGPQSRGVVDTKGQNLEIAEACKAFPYRFPIGLGVVEVRHETPGVDELERSIRDDGLLGFMCHPILSGHALEEELNPFLEVVHAHGGLCLLHLSGTSAKIAAYAKRYPDTSFIIGHASMGHEVEQDIVEHCGSADNIWLDLAQKPDPEEDSWTLHKLVSRVGLSRVMFGSDAPYYDYRRVQNLIENSSLSESEVAQVASGNAMSLIRKFKPLWELPMAAVEVPTGYPNNDIWITNGRRLT